MLSPDGIKYAVLFELILIFLGFLIMSLAIAFYFRLYKSVNLIKESLDTLTKVLFKVYIVLMLFFLVGYAAVGAYIFLGKLSGGMELISLIFFFGSIFVIIGIVSQKRLTDGIYNGNIQLIRTLISAVEARDINLKGHSMHVMAISLMIYDRLPKNKADGIDRKMLEYASLMHDIGKLGIPESILNKPGKLDEAEWNIMRDHPQIGTQILSSISGLSEVREWILYHHERLDGNGYYKVPGERVPFAARIICIADAYSAIVMRRSYKSGLEHDAAISLMRECVGTQFDPLIFEVLSSISKDKIKKTLEYLS